MLAVLEGAVLVEMVKQVAQLRQRIDMDDQPLPISIGLQAGKPFPRPDLVSNVGVSVVAFLSSDCSTCREIGSALAQLPSKVHERVTVTPVVEARTAAEIEEFRADTLLGEQDIVVDYGRELGQAAGIGTRPSVLMLHDGVMVEASAVRTSRQLTSFIERASRIVTPAMPRGKSEETALVRA